MTIIIPDKNKLYIQPEYPISDKCRNRLTALAEKLNYNSQVKTLIQRENYNPQIKQLLKREIKCSEKFQRDKCHKTISKHVKTSPIRFKRGK